MASGCQTKLVAGMTGKLRPLTEAEEARIQAGAAADPDNPELADEQMATAKRFAKVFPELAERIDRAPSRARSGTVLGRSFSEN